MDYLGKGEIITNGYKQMCEKNVHMENFIDLLFQLMK
jgi:hypothetical protein